MKWLLTLCFLAVPFLVFSQDQPPADTNGSHIIFLHKKVKSIEKIEYKDHPEKLDGNMGHDEESVILKNYKDRKRVLVTVVNMDGTRETIERSPCTVFENIDL